ncbi:WASP-interacting protein VRP1/WIP [Rhodotorula toruloides ATCC 204091]|uniref:WASP-interacting protein VRP1/WIP n=1 Tax=Rhodotorula toruloides TaxID=5286 RepID=A0A0K3CAW6_RHOTO|nr:WASP-interacting protein VRP1/WIP [Rhodotorula toruloides ATCC 204091]KAK4334759.1 WASP-interacting protein VRP1/WIP [Rhodotorula toruloides]PRQ76124.1 WASP-interacting protein VRP1/WIP [Rhodotorula toruloides]
MGCFSSRQTDSSIRHKHGLVPPHLALRLARYVFQNDSLYVPKLPPRYSLECELLWRSVPATLWYAKDVAAKDAEEQLVRVREQMEHELEERVKMLDMGYTVLYRANFFFFLWLFRHGITPEHGYQALEEYAEGAAGGLAPFWPDEARDSCSEGALVAAEWVLARFETEKAELGKLPPPQLAFLATDNPDYRLYPHPTPVTIIPPRNPAARILGLIHCAPPEQPPPYTSSCDSREADTANSSPNSSLTKAHSSDSGHGQDLDLINFEEDPSSPSPHPPPAPSRPL